MNFLNSREIELFATQGYLIIDHWLNVQRLNRVQADFDQLQQNGFFKKAAIARPDISSLAAATSIRADWTFWLEDSMPGLPASLQEIYSSLLEWIPQLNENFYCGVSSLEAHLAFYPVGPGYEMHLDQAHQQNSRKVSLVLYLNGPWPEKAAGELLLYSADQKNILNKISPLGGRLVIFRSDIFPHEVVACQQPRRSLTGWFRSDAL